VDTHKKVQTVCLLILTTIALGAALLFLRPVLIPFVLALFLVYALKPAIDLQMRRLRLGRLPAVINTMLLGCIVLLLAWNLIWDSVGELASNVSNYESQIQELILQGAERLPLERLGVDQEQFSSFFSLPEGTVQEVDQPAREPAATDQQPAGSLFSLPQGTFQGAVGGLVGAVMGFLSNGLLVIIFMIFIMAGSTNPPPAEGSLRYEIERGVERYILTKVFISTVTGVLVAMTLAILGVPFAVAFGVLALLLNFIPNIGSFIATLLPLPVVMLSPDLGPVAKVLAIAIPGVIQFSVGNLIEPKVMGGSLGLHPVVILLGLIFFGMIWGILGMFLATPIVAVIKIILERIEITAPAARALEGRLEAG
jgi:AI-2 transport protein TqsA